MTFFAVILGTLGAGVGSVWIAAMLSFGALARYTQHMLSLAAGALLATAFMHMLPEAFEGAVVSPQVLFTELLAAIVFFFLLDKAELWHHGHEHHHASSDEKAAHSAHEYNLSALETSRHVHDHGHMHHHGAASPGSWAVLAGDSIHCFGDGFVIASAFLASIELGVMTAIAVLAHEVPHHMGDLMVLRQGSSNRRMALVKVSLAGAVTTLGGVVGYVLVDGLQGIEPYLLVLAASSFAYVAMADLIPQLQKRLDAKETGIQVAFLFAGIGLVTLMSNLAREPR